MADDRNEREQISQFGDMAVGDLKGTMAVLLAGIGDALGLFKVLADAPVSARELAEQAAINERYALEWLNGMTAATYITYDPHTEKYVLPAGHVPFLAQEFGPLFLGGVYYQLPALWYLLPRLTEAMRQGGGVPIDTFDPCWFEGQERFTGVWYENFLVQQWIPAAPGVAAKLHQGADVADIGCGQGRAMIKLAQAFPTIRAVGYDVLETNIETARSRAAAARVSDRVTFEQRDVGKGIPGQFDLITVFETLHDLPDPAGAIKAIRTALRPGGSFLLWEIRCGEKAPEDNIGPIGTLLYGWSLTHCLTTALAQGGIGHGACGMPKSRVEKACVAAGFSRVDELAIDNPTNVLYHAVL